MKRRLQKASGSGPMAWPRRGNDPPDLQTNPRSRIGGIGTLQAFSS